MSGVPTPGMPDPLDEERVSQETAEENLIKDLVERMERQVTGGMVPIPDDVSIRVARLALNRFGHLHSVFCVKVFIAGGDNEWAFHLVA